MGRATRDFTASLNPSSTRLESWPVLTVEFPWKFASEYSVTCQPGLTRREETSGSDPPPTSRDAYRLRESEEIARLLEAHRWNISETARALGMSRTTLYAKMRCYGLSE